jgi:hypothetical protein
MMQVGGRGGSHKKQAGRAARLQLWVHQPGPQLCDGHVSCRGAATCDWWLGLLARLLPSRPTAYSHLV